MKTILLYINKMADGARNVLSVNWDTGLLVNLYTERVVDD